MTAADSLKALERKAQAVTLTRRGLYVIAAIVLLAGVYCAGSRHGTATTEAKQQDAQVAAFTAKQTALRDSLGRINDSLIAVNRRLAADTQQVHAARIAAQRSVARFDSAAAMLTQAADTSTSGMVSVALALPPMEMCQNALSAKDALIAAQAKLIVDLTTK